MTGEADVVGVDVSGQRYVESHLGREFKYVESIAERETVAIAHHAAYAACTLLL